MVINKQILPAELVVSYIPVTLDQVHTTLIKNCEKLGEPTKNLYNAAEP
jgi:hypothetical protein